MSIEIYEPYGENGPQYEIGTEGLEHSRTGVLGFVADIFRRVLGTVLINALINGSQG